MKLTEFRTVRMVLTAGLKTPDSDESRVRGGVALMLSSKAKDAWMEGGTKWRAWSSRLIVATLDMGRHKNDGLNVLSCYAPTFGVSREKKEQFYADLQQALSVIPPRECYVRCTWASQCSGWVKGR